jgi:hypothetical protein
MKEFSFEQKKDLRNRIIAAQEASGLSANEFAVKKLQFTNGSKLSHVRNNWDKEGMVGQETWEVIENYLAKTESYRGVVTENLKKVFNTCEIAFTLKKPLSISGEKGSGKTFGFESYIKHTEPQKRMKLVYFDASLYDTDKQLIAGLMDVMNCYKTGTIHNQLLEIRATAQKQPMLILFDEASSLKGIRVTIIKGIMTALKDICGIVFAGTPYFFDNLNRGAIRNRYLFAETRDRQFMLPIQLGQPSPEEAEAIFRINGINDKETLDIVLGRKKEFLSHSWLAKKTFRGVEDCITMVKMANMPSIDYSTVQL